MVQHESLEDVVEQQLSITRQLLPVDSRLELANAIVDVSRSLVDGVSSAVYLEQDRQLVKVSEERHSKLDCPDVCSIDDGPLVSSAFRTNEKQWARDTHDECDQQGDGAAEALSGKVAYPLDEFGAVVAGVHDGALSASNHRLLETIAASSTTALQQTRDEQPELGGCAAAFETLNAKTSELLQAESREAIADIVAATVERLLSRPTAVFLWDEQDGRLRTFSTADDGGTFSRLSTSVADGPVWDAFVETETRLVTDPDSPTTGLESTPVESALAVPIGDDGVVLVGSTDPDYFSDSDVELVELVASNAEAALTRTAIEATVRTQEARLQEQHDRLADLRLANTIVRDIQNCLVRADNRDDVLESVCANLTTHEHVEFAWIGHQSAEQDSLRVDAWSGDGRGVLDYLLDARADERPLPAQVVDADEAVTVDRIAKRDSFESWREPALKRGFQSVICLPLTWKDHNYGFLEIYGSRPGLFEDMEALLAEVATNVANAINAVDRKAALVSGQSTELALEVADADDPLFELARRVEGRLTVDGIVPRSDGSWLVYLDPHGAAVESLVEECNRFVSIEDVNVIRTDDEHELLGLVVSEFTLIETLGNQGATIQSIEVRPDGGTVTVTVPPSTDIRAFVESCEQRLGPVSMTRCESIRDAGSVGDLRYDLEDIVTEKQFEALQAGFFNGFFEVPREHTGQEIAAKLNVSGPTFQHHVRKGMQRILNVVFEDGTNT